MEPEVKKEDGRYAISMEQVTAAYKKVRSNKGAGGVDGMSWEEFDKQHKKLLYKLWNRMTSGSYFPKATREVIIPKAGGGERRLGIPVLLDRIAQQVVVDILEPVVEKVFHPNSYGYRPGKSAHDALAQCRQMCFRYGWAIDLDIIRRGGRQHRPWVADQSGGAFYNREMDIDVREALAEHFNTQGRRKH